MIIQWRTQKLNSNAIEKALRILMAFYPRNSEMGTVDLSRKTGFHIATVNRILQILARNRFLSQNPLTRKFNLGPSVFALGEAAIESLSDNLLHKALPHLNELCERVRETVVLELISGAGSIVAYVAQGSRPWGSGPISAVDCQRMPRQVRRRSSLSPRKR